MELLYTLFMVIVGVVLLVIGADLHKEVRLMNEHYNALLKMIMTDVNRLSDVIDDVYSSSCSYDYLDSAFKDSDKWN